VEVLAQVAVAGHAVQAVAPVLPELLGVAVHPHGDLGATAAWEVRGLDDLAREVEQ